MSPALSGSSAIQCFKHSNAIEICDGISFDFYTGLPHTGMWYWHLDVAVPIGGSAVSAFI